MTFVPVVPLGGIAGLRFLDQTYDRQFETFGRQPQIQRDIDAFLENASSFQTVDDLMQDRSSLRVVLGAFGLDDDLNKGAFVRKIIEEGSLDSEAFANRLAEPAYREMAATLGFGDLGTRLTITSVREDLAARYRERQFEQAVGDQNIDMRLALNFRREIDEITNSETADRSGWLRVLGSQPLRNVVESAFGLPQQFGLLDLDQQVSELESLSRQRFGEASPTVFQDPEVVEDMLAQFLVRSEVNRSLGIGTPLSSEPTGGSTALSILQSGGLGPSSQAGLFASNFG
ncbi:MAG: DUF1217 domain-containing protein [Pseudomonadota bacterium]